MPRVRFSVRGMMIAVAIVGALLWGWIWTREMVALRALYRQKAAAWGMYEQSAKTANMGEEYVKYFAGMRANCERAARYPWLPVAPDPPEPE